MSGGRTLFDAAGLPPPWPAPLLETIWLANQRSGHPIVILDDDPLGGQCLHDVPVLTTWEPRNLAEEMDQSEAFLLLTNTRALSRDDAGKRARDVGFALRQASIEAAKRPTLVWRSDSTLRGHFWREMAALAEEFDPDGMPPPVYVFVPYFGEAGRVTLDDVQYVLEGRDLIPVHETEFAHDPAFAYRSSHLPGWLEAHSEGKFRATDVVSISLKDIRDGGPDRVATVLSDVPEGSAVIVNAIDDCDLEVFVAGLQEAEGAGGSFLCTGAAPFIRARLGQEKSPLLTASGLGLGGSAGGLTIVGSYVEKTTAQLKQAFKDPGVIAVELPTEIRSHDITRVSSEVSDGLEAGRDVILYSSREREPDAAAAIADVFATIVSDLDVRPRYLLVKGGSTASHLATGVLGVRRAMVLGQLLAGVPVWRLGDESRWPGLPFVIFAGNVGSEGSLAEALRILRPSTSSG